MTLSSWTATQLSLHFSSVGSIRTNKAKHIVSNRRPAEPMRLYDVRTGLAVCCKALFGDLSSDGFLRKATTTSFRRLKSGSPTGG
jgi:hypothetical protein